MTEQPGLPDRSPAPRWLAWGSVLLAGLLSLACFAPRFWLWPALDVPIPELANQPELHRAHFTLEQVAQPWRPVANPSNRVLDWRLLFPVIAHYLHLPPRVFLALPWLGCGLCLFAVARWLQAAGAGRSLVLGGTLLAATSSWFFVSTGWLAYFDSWLILAVVLACCLPSRRGLLAVALVAPWIDERFILALPLCVGLRAFLQPAAAGRALALDTLHLAGGVLPYALVRLGAELAHLRQTTGDYLAARPLSGRAALLPLMFAGAWQGLRAGWLGVAALAVGAVRARRAWILPAVLSSLLASFALTDDLSRSAALALPAMLAGLLWLRHDFPRTARVLVPLLGLANLALPARHVVTTFQTPLAPLATELALWLNPPALANADTYNDQGQAALRHQQPLEAIRLFTLALQLSPAHAEARANRGIVNFLAGAETAGLQDLDRALQEKPEQWHARLMRARFLLRRGARAQAEADLRAVLAGAPAAWPERPAAEQLAAELAAAGP